ncbi:hypothetical protein P5673_025925 [Acropora cervicornis]|uniref:Receptor L-domain domain-containing protein n=1 Tax=Acropora cervicornis TaxID=6130 RepID=A0AAD9UX31_ACRCE|nr:hypothetical protein P5673_025925 [Acropora cervicornis]
MNLRFSHLLDNRSDDTDFNNKCEEMCQFFKKRGYPDSAVTTGKHRAQEIDRETALQTSQDKETDRIPFTHTYHPQNLAIKNVILKNFKILRNDPETKHMFSLPPLISFKRDKNLGNLLVRSAFKFNDQPGTFTCKRTRCKTCPFLSNTVKISGPNRSVKVTDHFTCISTNVIYCITCTLCKKICIGETGRRLADRFREHLRDAEQNNTDASKPVARHFNLPSHSHHNMTICGLSLHHGNTESRKNLEQKFIFQLGIGTRLDEKLGKIEKVKGYILIRESSSLTSLNFLKNLKEISPRPNIFVKGQFEVYNDRMFLLVEFALVSFSRYQNMSVRYFIDTQGFIL